MWNGTKMLSAMTVIYLISVFVEVLVGISAASRCWCMTAFVTRRSYVTTFFCMENICLTNKQIFLLAVKWFVVDIFGCVLQQCQTVSLALRLIMENMASINLVLFCLCLATIHSSQIYSTCLLPRMWRGLAKLILSASASQLHVSCKAAISTSLPTTSPFNPIHNS